MDKEELRFKVKNSKKNMYYNVYLGSQNEFSFCNCEYFNITLNCCKHIMGVVKRWNELFNHISEKYLNHPFNIIDKNFLSESEIFLIPPTNKEINLDNIFNKTVNTTDPENNTNLQIQFNELETKEMPKIQAVEVDELNKYEIKKAPNVRTPKLH